MAQINTREICLFNGTVTTSGIGPDINLLQNWQAAIVSVSISAASGTTPTMGLFIQSKLGQASATDTSGSLLTGTPIYDDLLSFASLTTTGVRIARPLTSAIGSGTPATSGSVAAGMDYAQSDAALAASAYRLGPMGGQWRVKFIIGGTTPSFTFSVQAQLIPYSS